MLVGASYPRYQGDVYRPPSEARSLILQVMYGCSHNKCAFCGMYRDKLFRMRPFSEVAEDVRCLPKGVKAGIRRVFLADGDALALPTRSLLRIMGLLNAELPLMERVSSYANPQSLLRKSEEDLRLLRASGLALLYVGLESGDDDVLGRMNKGVPVSQAVEACQKAKKAGFELSLTVILGLGGVERSLAHARATGRVLSVIDPAYMGVLTLMLVPGTPLEREAAEGRFVVPDAHGLLRELREMVVETEVTHTVFRATHASNYLPLQGTLPYDKPLLLQTMDGILSHRDRMPLKPEWLRGL